jgi:hypothetical protein
MAIDSAAASSFIFGTDTLHFDISFPPKEVKADRTSRRNEEPVDGSAAALSPVRYRVDLTPVPVEFIQRSKSASVFTLYVMQSPASIQASARKRASSLAASSSVRCSCLVGRAGRRRRRVLMHRLQRRRRAQEAVGHRANGCFCRRDGTAASRERYLRH